MVIYSNVEFLDQAMFEIYVPDRLGLLRFFKNSKRTKETAMTYSKLSGFGGQEEAFVPL